MRQQEAEQEAERRNAADERRDRLVFYALDESAGLADDAWTVAVRLRRPDEFRWELPAEPPSADVVAAHEESESPSAAVAAAEPLTATPPRRRERRRRARASTADTRDAGEPDRRSAVPVERAGPRLVRAWGYFVMLVGALFIAVVLAIWLGFRTYLQIGPVVIGVLVAAGVFAIWIGAQIARPPR